MLLRRRRLLYALDEKVRCHVGTRAGGFGALFRPREVAFLTIVLFLDQPEFRQKAHSKVRHEELPGKLWIVDLERLAFRTANSISQCRVGRVASMQQLVG